MPLTEDERLEYQERIMVAEAKLKERQSIWETPRNIAILVGTAVAFGAAVAGVLGFNLGRNSPAPTIVFQPGSIVVQQAAPSQK
jgi:hypothetical protein